MGAGAGAVLTIAGAQVQDVEREVAEREDAAALRRRLCIRIRILLAKTCEAGMCVVGVGVARAVERHAAAGGDDAERERELEAQERGGVVRDVLVDH